ncbi:MAG: DinB family protein [Treponema sp.]|jgi:uncharacterized damage-inducible protein DinB|nr:DinB family protein [Treponema sp.]
MTSDVFTLLAKYNGGVNEKMSGYIRDLNDEDWNREFNGFFSSVRSLCSHLYISDFNWLKRFGSLRQFQALNAPLFEQNFSFHDTIFPGRDEYLIKRPVLDRKLIEFTAEIKDEDLSQILKYTDSHGTAHGKRFELPLFQMFNHQTHHRGMISLYLEFMGRENDFSAVMPIVGD